MTLPRFICTLTTLLCLGAAPASASPFKTWKETPQPADTKLPMCGLPPAKVQSGLCVVKYRVNTNSAECQALFDQGLGYFYSYVWMEAARSFETACRHDPDCALAWWGLSRALEQYRRPHVDALKKAQALMPKTSHREQLLIQARLEEKGMWPNVGNAEARLKAAIKTIDTLLALYDDDEEGWYARAQLSGGAGFFGGQVSSVPFYKALLKLNPLHPGANHELVHFYENMKRPALGWPFAEKYIESTPGIPHSYHMQAHLATRIGRWDKTTDWSVKAVALERAYHKEVNVKPSQDQQFAHHCEILMRCLIHDGRFAEAREHKKQCQADNIKHTQVWFRLHLAERDYEAALKIAEDERKRDKNNGSYLAALVHLKNNDLEQAEPEVAALEEALEKRKTDKQLQLKFWEVQGILMCQQENPDEGLKLLVKAVEKTKGEYSHHAWGNGSYHMLAWGLAALASHRYEAAEEGFLEALAHDSGCFHAALGLQVLCEKLGRKSEAARYAALAQRFWRKADPNDAAKELDYLRSAIGLGPAPKGPNKIAQGNALGINAHFPVSPERARQRAHSTPVSPVQGFLPDDNSDPRALPWADMFGPLGANWQGLTGGQGSTNERGLNDHQPFHSSLLPGERPGPYAALIITGTHRGTPHCFICETADKPAVLIFARQPSDALGKLANRIDKALAVHKDADLRSWITFMNSDHTKVDAQLIDWSRKHAISNVPLGVFEDVGGPPSYRIAQDADATVLLFVNQKVTINFSFRAGELTDARIEEVLAALPELVKQ